MKTGLKSSTQQVFLNNIENHHTCGKNMPLIQCTGGVLPKLGEVRSYAKICQQRDGTWTKTLKTFPNPCPLLSNPWFFLSVDKVDCNRATHSSSGRMPHVRWCLGTNLETTWKIRIQNLLCSVWIFLKLSETFSRLASCTAQWFQRQWTLLGPRIRVRCKLHEVATSYILSVIVTMLSTTKCWR